MKLYVLLFLFAALGLNFKVAASPIEIRLGVMASGTLAWELAAMKNAGLLDNADYSVQPVNLANQQAGKVALQAGSVDIIISDWIWVSSMRAEGADYTFYPYSNSAGGLLTPAGSSIKTLADLQGKKLGIAGGELDKNWLLLQALGQKQGLDLNKTVEKTYAAPPLLNQEFSAKHLDALLTYWQFAARLETEGNVQLLSGEEIIRQLGITDSVPSLGYVFKASWGQQNKSALHSFLRSAKQAKESLCNDDNAWQSIANLTETTTATALQQTRSRYCLGLVTQWGIANQEAAGKIYQLLHQLDTNKLTAKHPQLQTGTFWSID
ncbi:ABC transporter substrate-binding protein [Methylomonas sp. AM2-LC]|uniref:ABC transporter substrate-binding protein n=1 Tax=Methylomonas sp. AM2-LC TaxID=3153301 RepID=UPI003266A04A